MTVWRPQAPVTVITGHYGVGKTNLAMNLALDWAKDGLKVVLADLDVVNPYFRSSDYTDQLERAGVDVIAPVLAGTSLDTPSLSGKVSTAITWAREGSAGPDRALIIDAGGDDVGATALGRFAPLILQGDYAMLYVVNRYRALAHTPEEALTVLREIEEASGLAATAVANNSHLKADTDRAVVAESLDFGERVAAAAGIPLAFATVPIAACGDGCADELAAEDGKNVYPVNVYVRTPWE